MKFAPVLSWCSLGYGGTSCGTHYTLRNMLNNTPKDTLGDYMTGSGVSATSLTKATSFVNKMHGELNYTFVNTI